VHAQIPMFFIFKLLLHFIRHINVSLTVQAEMWYLLGPYYSQNCRTTFAIRIWNVFFFKRGKSFAFSLIKKKRVAQLINGKPG
jgi:hypothetical protein